MRARAARPLACLASLGIAGLLLGSGAQAHPGHGTAQVTVAGDTQEFTPASVSILKGESVEWTWRGALRNHSVTADPGQRESFDSDPGGEPDLSTHPEGDAFVHRFELAGTYTYHCKVHPSMTGEVVVRRPPGERPRIRKLRVRDGVACDGADCEPARARYRLSKRASVVGRIERRRSGEWRIAKAFARQGRPGPNRVTLPTKRLDAGTYRLSLAAYDAYNRRSRIRRETFALR